MKDFFKENIKILTFFLLIATCFPIIILYPSCIGVIPYEIGLTIIGYGGAILGGFLTLYGVWWTIDDQNRKRLNETKPLLALIGKDRIIKQYRNNISIKLRLKNLGSYEAKNVSIHIEEITSAQKLVDNIIYTNYYSIIAKEMDVSGSMIIKLKNKSMKNQPILLKAKILYVGIEKRSYSSECILYISKQTDRFSRYKDQWIFHINDFKYKEET